MFSRLCKSLSKLAEKVCPAGTLIKGDNVDGILECIAEHYVGGAGCDCAINVSDFQKVMEKATDTKLDHSCETVSEVISALYEKLSFEQMNGEFEYAENLTDGEVTSYSIKGIGSVTNTDLVFPETYNGKPVTLISISAFENNETITSIVIPDSYTSIGMDAFRGCTALESAVIGNGITGIGTNVFLYAELKRVKFGNSITRITSYAFNGCPLELLDFRKATVVPTLDDGTIFVGMAEGCQIVVPDALYDEWSTATRWAALEKATFIKASEYTEV